MTPCVTILRVEGGAAENVNMGAGESFFRRRSRDLGDSAVKIFERPPKPCGPASFREERVNRKWNRLGDIFSDRNRLGNESVAVPERFG